VDKPDQTSVTLDSPIKRGDTEITSVMVRKPMPGSLRGTKMSDILQGDVNALLTVLPRITEPTLLEPEIAVMDPSDFGELTGAVIGFFLTKAQKAMLG
jgi:Phage tail assembly chaperone proteins, E, or 41 or 14